MVKIMEEIAGFHANAISKHDTLKTRMAGSRRQGCMVQVEQCMNGVGRYDPVDHYT